MKKKLLILVIIVGVFASALFFWPKNNVKILSHVESDFGPVWVYEQEQVRCMSFSKPPSSIIQGCMLLENPKITTFHYSRMFLGSLFIKDQPKKILMLGLGVGTVPRALNILVPEAEQDIIEINPVIPPLVEEYFGFRENNKNHIFVEDAFDFVKRSPSDVYDIVFLDAFSPEYIPPSLLTNEFMQNVKKVLTKDGIVVMNTFASSKFKEKEMELIKSNFGEYYSMSTVQSKVMMASKGELPDLPEITYKSNLWRYRFIEVGVSQQGVLDLLQKLN